MRADTPRPGAFIDRLGDADRDALLRTGRPRHYRKGEPIFIAGDSGGFVLLLSSGHVKVTAPAVTGTEAVLSLRGPGDLIGELSALDEGPDRRVATVVALEPVTCRVVPAADFRAVLHDHPGIALALLHMLSERLRAADRRIVEFGAYDTVRRVARLLADLAGSAELSAEATIPALPSGLTQDDLAGMVGASRESVARALATLRSLGLVSTGRGRVDVLDLDGLRSFGG